VYLSRVMSRRLFALLALAPVALACSSSAGNLTCATPTKKQSLMFTADGSCGKGPVTISTQPGLCTLTVTGGLAAFGFPDLQGQFLGTASESAMGYDLTQPYWNIFVNEGNEEDGSTEVTCDLSIASAGVLNFACSGMVCQPDDCGEAQCDFPDCTETLTPSQ
jgi:hypothetical protein